MSTLWAVISLLYILFSNKSLCSLKPSFVELP